MREKNYSISLLRMLAVISIIFVTLLSIHLQYL